MAYIPKTDIQYFRLTRAFEDNAFSVCLKLPDERNSGLYYAPHEGGKHVSNLGKVAGHIYQRGPLEDFLASNFSWDMVSAKVQNLVRQVVGDRVVFLDIGLAAIDRCLAGYTLMFPQEVYDFVDREASEIVWADVDGTPMVERWYTLVLSAKAIATVEPIAPCFSLKHFPFFSVASKELVDALREAKVTGFDSTPIAVQ